MSVRDRLPIKHSTTDWAEGGSGIAVSASKLVGEMAPVGKEAAVGTSVGGTAVGALVEMTVGTVVGCSAFGTTTTGTHWAHSAASPVQTGSQQP